ncbi:MAG: peptidoglycan-binding protein, partial [Cetobacterium sp.]
LQQILINSGYGVGISGVDGDFGGGTESAVKAFQRANGLDDDGIVGGNTWKALEGIKGSGTYSGLLKLGARGQGVTILQEELIKKGYSVGKYGADGVFGEGTREAVKAFQRTSGLDDDGIVGPSTWGALHSEIDTQYVGGEGVEKFLNVAISQLGYHEQWENMTKYGAWYGMNGVSWCAIFVSWCANRAGILYNTVPRYSYCANGANWYRNRNRYGRRGQYTPKPGDVIFFYDASEDDPYYHTGIVEYVEGNTVYTVEGNASNSVRRNSYDLSHWKIHGYGMNGGISYKKDLKQEELDKINNLDLSKALGVSFGKTEKKKVIFKNTFLEISYQRSANINIGGGSAFSFSFNEKGELTGGGISTGIANLMLKLGTDGSAKLEKVLKSFYGMKFSLIAPIDGSLGVTLKTTAKINDNYSIALLLNIEFKVDLDEIKENIEEITKEAVEVLGYIAIPLIILGYIISVIATSGATAVAAPEVAGVILAILFVNKK